LGLVLLAGRQDIATFTLDALFTPLNQRHEGAADLIVKIIGLLAFAWTA
jgi:hypothetical protein